jgi:Golgi nucleoside diphosphatase
MYRTNITTTSCEEFEVEFDTLSQAVAFANNTSRTGDRVQIFSVLDGLCGPEVQDLILEYIEDGWESYD